MEASTLASTIEGTFFWDQNIGGATNDNYNNYMNDFAGIFDHTDQHHFLAFDNSNSFRDILDILGDFFRIEIDSSIKIEDFSKR